jgi:hypothetical protein
MSAEHEDDVRAGQHQDEIGDQHQPPIEPAAARPGDPTHEDADEERTNRPAGGDAERQLRAAQEPREDIAPELVGAKQQERTVVLVDRDHASLVEPTQRNRTRTIVAVGARDAIVEMLRVHERCVPASGVPEVHAHRRRVRPVRELIARPVRRDRWTDERDQRDRRDRNQTRAQASCGCHVCSRTRGSTTARPMSAMTLPSAMSTAPASAQPATR